MRVAGASHLAGFHAAAEPAPAGSFGPPQVAATVSENFTTLLALRRRDRRSAPRCGSPLRGRLPARPPRRSSPRASQAGHIRDCHGDLRAEHVILEEDGVAIFDPVEFDPALRADRHGRRPGLSRDGADRGGPRGSRRGRSRAEYRAAGGDDGGDELLAFYAAYRAWVRAKVACLRAAELPAGERDAQELEHARGLAALGERLSWRARRPLVLVVCGASATGKTVLAEALAAVAGLAQPELGSGAKGARRAARPSAARRPASTRRRRASRTYRELGARARGRGRTGRRDRRRDLPAPCRPRRVRAPPTARRRPRRCSSSAGRRPRSWPSGHGGASSSPAGSRTRRRRSRCASSPSSSHSTRSTRTVT